MTTVQRADCRPMLCDVEETGGGPQSLEKKKGRRSSPAAADCKAGSARGKGEVAVAADRLGTDRQQQHFVKATGGRRKKKKKKKILRTAEFGKDCKGVTAETTQKWNRENK